MMPGYLAGTHSIAGHQFRHAAAWFSGRQVIIALIIIAIIIILLVGSVLAEYLLDFLSQGVEKATPGAFFLGLGVLLAGLAFGFRILDIVGACLLGAVALGVTLNNYLPSIRHAFRGP